ncbi:lipopolysaccharide transport periplasmic protein LptA [Acidiferrobacter sp.]|uniref:lipopolysaccharide transport periplasmic protein LptA n=1 Tax=Acidiferrobacter sp. TaxID=1872107 RepID=UPI00261C4AEA|nr:lipopolysaccharide transport periplasmic protein LptA [Acidiferrobacter sp.]
MTKKWLVAVCALCLASTGARARNHELAQPLSVRANSIQVDERTGMSLYQGHVRIVQDGLTVRADWVRVHSLHGHVLSIHAQGAPLHMEDQKTRGLPLFGTARSLDFAAAPDEVTLTGHVIFRQGGNVLHGHIVHYYVRSQRITALRGPHKRVRARVVPDHHAPRAKGSH